MRKYFGRRVNFEQTFVPAFCKWMEQDPMVAPQVLAPLVTNMELMMVRSHVGPHGHVVWLVHKWGQHGGRDRRLGVSKLHNVVRCQAIIVTKAPEPEGKALNLQVDLYSDLQLRSQVWVVAEMIRSKDTSRWNEFPLQGISPTYPSGTVWGALIYVRKVYGQLSVEELCAQTSGYRHGLITEQAYWA